MEGGYEDRSIDSSAKSSERDCTSRKDAQTRSGSGTVSEYREREMRVQETLRALERSRSDDERDERTMKHERERRRELYENPARSNRTAVNNCFTRYRYS